MYSCGDHKEKAPSWLSHRIAGSNSQRAWVQLRATLNVETNDDVVKGPGEQSPVAAAMAEAPEATHKEKARNWLSLLTSRSIASTGRVQSELAEAQIPRIAGTNIQRAWSELQATPNIKTSSKELSAIANGLHKARYAPEDAKSRKEGSEGFRAGIRSRIFV